MLSHDEFGEVVLDEANKLRRTGYELKLLGSHENNEDGKHYHYYVYVTDKDGKRYGREVELQQVVLDGEGAMNVAIDCGKKLAHEPFYCLPDDFYNYTQKGY
jgi:hypothetical protein